MHYNLYELSTCFLSISAGRLLAPVIKDLSKTYPEVTTYKIDIDQVGTQC